MTALELWTGIGLMLLGTWGTRAVFFIMGKAGRLPPRVQHALSFAPAVALAALLAPDFFLEKSGEMAALTDPRLLAGLCATVFFMFTKNMLAMIVFGMAVYTAARLWL